MARVSPARPLLTLPITTDCPFSRLPVGIIGVTTGPATNWIAVT